MTKPDFPSFEAVATAGLFLMTLAMLGGCGTGEEAPSTSPSAKPAEAPTTPSLADTRWRLIDFTSMDDATGVRKPQDSSRYTMQLDADGTVRFRLNCNRAIGTWEAEPAAGGGSGTFRFGPLAATRALCPPPSMDELVSAQAPYVRGYLLRDGNLYLSLMADGGIFAWEPDGSRPTADPP